MSDTVYRTIVIILLAVNTFFIGSIWCTLKCSSCPTKKEAFCPIRKSAAYGKICPITGKPLQSAEIMKGSMAK